MDIKNRIEILNKFAQAAQSGEQAGKLPSIEQTQQMRLKQPKRTKLVDFLTSVSGIYEFFERSFTYKQFSVGNNFTKDSLDKELILLQSPQQVALGDVSDKDYGEIYAKAQADLNKYRNIYSQNENDLNRLNALLSKVEK